jgi:hypothetical protein
MKRTFYGIMILILFGAASYLVLQPSGHASARNQLPLIDDTLKKEQPKKIKLGKDSLDDKYGEVAFDHESHSTKPYSVGGKSVLACTECHHTDQPESTIKPPYKKSERSVVLTAEALKAPGAVGVKTCRACHLQKTDKSKELPLLSIEGKPPLKLDNELAYHRNCNLCHDDAIKANPALKGKAWDSTECAPCHEKLE